MTHGGYREGNPTYRLTASERRELAVLASLGLWSSERLARCFGVSRKTVYDLKGTVA